MGRSETLRVFEHTKSRRSLTRAVCILGEIDATVDGLIEADADSLPGWLTAGAYDDPNAR